MVQAQKPAMKLGHYLKGLREDRKLSMEELARRSNNNVNKSTISRIESGKVKKPNRRTLAIIAQELELDAAESARLAKLGGYKKLPLYVLKRGAPVLAIEALLDPKFDLSTLHRNT